MHKETQEFIEQLKRSFPDQSCRDVLDIGSRKFHAQWTPRDLFPYYTGIDLESGPNVDLIMDSHYLEFGNESFDLVLCVNFLEHDPDPQATIREARRVLRRRGILAISAASEGTNPHEVEEAGGFYRNVSLADLAGWLEVREHMEVITHYHKSRRGKAASDVFLVAVKR